jgi:hypothetical protein
MNGTILAALQRVTMTCRGLTMRKRLTAIMLASMVAGGGAQAAGTTIYADPGVAITKSYSFFKLTGGDLLVSFLGATAGYTSYLGVIADGVDLGLGLSNEDKRGTTKNYGFVEAGSGIQFYLDVETTGQRYFSNPDLNEDGLNHLFASFYGGGNRIGGKWFQRASYAAIGFEDMAGGGDHDYDDARFIAQEVGLVEEAPEPATWAMMIMGFGLVGVAARRRRKAI